VISRVSLKRSMNLSDIMVFCYGLWDNGKMENDQGGQPQGLPPTDGVYYCGIVLGVAFSKITSGHTKLVVSKTTLAHDNPTPNAEARMR